MPFARATRAHVGASIELIEHLDARSRPDVFAIYPSWWDELPLWFGSRIGEVPARGNVICGAPSKVLYRANWAALEGSSRPFRLDRSERVVAELDWADVLSEDAAGYRRTPKAEGRIALKLLPNLAAPERDVYDAGRHTPEGTREHFTLRGIEPGLPLRLIVRAAPVADVSIPVSIDGKPAGTLELSRSDGWIEVSLRIEKAQRLDARGRARSLARARPLPPLGGSGAVKEHPYLTFGLANDEVGLAALVLGVLLLCARDPSRPRARVRARSHPSPPLRRHARRRRGRAFVALRRALPRRRAAHHRRRRLLSRRTRAFDRAVRIRRARSRAPRSVDVSSYRHRTDGSA